MEVSVRTSTGTGSQVTPGKMWQTIFRARLPGGQSEPAYHTRRAHKKSRGGCMCDEQKPTCQRCQTYGATCSYAPSPSPLHAGRSAVSVLGAPTKVMFSLTVAEMVSNIKEVLAGDLICAPRMIGDYHTVVSIAVDSFQQFVNISTNTVGSSMIQQVMKTDMIHVAFNSKSPYLMYTIIGCGILHLNRMCPGYKPRELAEAYFWQQAIKLYGRALQGPVTEHNIDPLVSACMLIGITSIIPPDFQPEDSWVLTGRSSDLNWLALQGGLNCILTLAGRLVNRSIWGVAFSISHEWETKLYRYDVEQGREGLCSELADLCEIDDTTTDATSPYYFALKILSPLLRLDFNAQNSSQCTTWMGRLHPSYVAMLRQRDPRALVIMAYWAGLMCKLSQWQPWIEGRIRQECIAICMYLERQGDPIIQPFLEFPASACGYALRPTVDKI
ncbi:hypothetical protein AOCH_000321 [Aspergillus ochraceoroseus]|nr:hypothetical protein AOCH_000321 [Aspergillus ochraceoroseus]